MSSGGGRPRLNRRGSPKRKACGTKLSRWCPTCAHTFPTRQGYLRHVVAHRAAEQAGCPVQEVEQEVRRLRREGGL